jgi:soluble cytochrome b562
MIVLITLIGVVAFQKLKPTVYETKAICMSGVAEYERQEQIEDLSQRTAIDLVNFLKINIDNEDYQQLSLLLGVDIKIANRIKGIDAEQLYQQDMNEKYYALNKFEVSLVVFDNTIIDDIQKGLVNYFKTNDFINKYHKNYIEGNKRLINEIDKEITVLSEMRIEGAKNSLDLSSVNIISGKEDNE